MDQAVPTGVDAADAEREAIREAQDDFVLQQVFFNCNWTIPRTLHPARSWLFSSATSAELIWRKSISFPSLLPPPHEERMCSNCWRSSLLSISLTRNALLVFARSMTGCKSGFKAFVKNAAPHIIFSHCIIHRCALAMKMPSASLRHILSVCGEDCEMYQVKGNRLDAYFECCMKKRERITWISCITRRFGGCPMVRSWPVYWNFGRRSLFFGKGSHWNGELSSWETARSCVLDESCLFEWLLLWSECLERFPSG